MWMVLVIALLTVTCMVLTCEPWQAIQVQVVQAYLLAWCLSLGAHSGRPIAALLPACSACLSHSWKDARMSCHQCRRCSLCAPCNVILLCVLSTILFEQYFGVKKTFFKQYFWMQIRFFHTTVVWSILVLPDCDRRDFDYRWTVFTLCSHGKQHCAECWPWVQCVTTLVLKESSACMTLILGSTINFLATFLGAV